MNDVTVDEGRLPEEPDEIFLDMAFMEQNHLEIGDTITLCSGEEDTPIEDILTTYEYTITGAGDSPFYMSLDRGTSRIGDGSVAGFAVVPLESFSMEVYTELYMTLEDTEEEICYQDSYKEKLDEVKERLEKVSRGRCKIRYASIQADGKEEIDLARQDIVDARQQLQDARTTLEDGSVQLEDGKQELSRQEQELLEGKTELEQQKNKIQSGKSQIEAARNQLGEQEALLAQKKQEIQNTKAYLAQQDQAIAAGLAQVEAGEQALAAGEQQLLQGEQAILQGEQKLEEGKQKIAALESLIVTLQPGVDVARTQLVEIQQNIDQANIEIQDYEDNIGQMKESLAQMEAELETLMQDPEENQLRIQILNGQISLKQQEIQISEQGLGVVRRNLERYQAAIAMAQGTIQQYDQAVVQLQQAQQEIAGKEQELINGKNEIANGKQELQQQKQILIQSRQQLESGKQQLDGGRQQLLLGEQQILMAEQQILAAKNELSSQGGQITIGEMELEKAGKTIADGEKALLEAKNTLQEKEQELEEGWETYHREAEDAEEEITDGEQQITDAQAELEKLEMPTWYVLGRDSIQTYVEYEQDTQRIVAIAKVFPVIFFLVAALICLTTMTRMVEENRTQIGTLKALGYGKAAIAGKYLCYALSASLVGSVIGFIAGQLFLPRVVIGAYSILYTNLPIIRTPIYPGYSVGSTVLAVGITVLAAGFACYRELEEVPAQLMRPEPPKNGKRILLEKITFIWKHLSFSNKATARNLFRYKKRFFMTILGIGGCMGLLMTGFGLKDSIMVIGEKQFGDIRIYQSAISMESDITMEEKEELMEKIQKDSKVSDYMEAYETSVDVAANDTEKASYLVVASDPEKFRDFVVLKNRLTKEEFQLDDDGVIITEKLAKLLDVKAGDKIFLKDGETKKLEVEVSHVVENYFFHYVYMTPAVYEKLYGEEPEYTEIFTVNKDNTKDFEQDFQKEYMDQPGVLNVSFLSAIHDRIKDMLKSMDTVIYVIVIAAGMLAFVVLYNLNNINISERRRELATLKVLGFYETEVSGYVFRENVVLTVIGAFLGIGFGFVLHRFMILTAEIDIMMFGRNMKPVSIVYSICLTFLFSFFVNLFMHFKLKKLDMVESMKSVE